ncbi:MAG: DUF3467 domain-containing protein [Myxococcales bacterium]|nr:DUF3467 domain-containing protein [Myxococcales bacterium]MCB9734421.1 DUF3467 domain-containing protein [Deltaproteobacteria bacterium]
MADNDEETPPTAIRIQKHLDEAMALGEYVNMAQIFHTRTEFVLDSMFLPPQSTTAKVVSRVILSPVQAKFLYRALGQNIQMYEQKFGEIQLGPPGSGDPGPILH